MPYFTSQTLDFLRELAANNNREWFRDNRSAYERLVREPALALIEEMGPRLAGISPHFRAVARRTGGSLMRVYRDTRYTRDKTPYKTNIGIHFRHEQGRDIHSPGYYLHIDPWCVFVSVGIWRPDSRTLGRIRERLTERPDAWIGARDDPVFRRFYRLTEPALKRAPRGYRIDHPLIEDLRRKSFNAVTDLGHEDALSPEFPDILCERFHAATPFLRFLCAALDLPM
ncbi:MAG: DUF2461 domain-containing protein [Gammaproteobacteria bacterium]|nr:MAG: DUF2461 domain-containing protein [Gammaproteobacteria bacterium]